MKNRHFLLDFDISSYVMYMFSLIRLSELLLKESGFDFFHLGEGQEGLGVNCPSPKYLFTLAEKLRSQFA